MKFLKKSLLIAMFILMSVCFTKTAPATTVADGVVLDKAVFDYVSISKYGQALTTDNFKNFGNYSYIITNDSLTINFQPFTFEYQVNLEGYETDFIASSTIVQIEYDDTLEAYANHFYVYDAKSQTDVVYYYKVNETTGVLNIYKVDPSTNSTASPIISSSRSNLFSYSEENHTITIVNSYTLKSNSGDAFFNFSVRATTGGTRSFSIGFLRPVVEFANANTENLVEFTCKGIDAGEDGFVNELIQKELTYNSVQIEFLNNNYTEHNQLYFNINYNGFIYNFELYSKIYDETSLLFVNYLDPEKESNNKYLATGLYLDDSDEPVLDTSNKVYTYNGDSNIFNTFSMIFDKTGRYEIEIYDSTYLLGINQPNYYVTSFYISDETKSSFDNIYIISQTQDNDGNDIEYIVSTSTLNNNVKTTIKNLNNLGTDANGKAIALGDVIEKIEIKKTTFGGSTNIPTYTDYSPEEVLDLLVDGDFVLYFSDDAYYEVNVYKKGNLAVSHYYEFTIVKHAKTTFTIPLVDEDGEPIFDENGKQKSETYEASTSFKTETKTYSKNILSSIDLKIEYSMSSLPHSTTLDKTYINKYTISYAVQKVSMEQYAPTEDEIEDGKYIKTSIYIDFKGIGDITVTVTCNGTETVYHLNYEKRNYRLELADYGTYTVHMVDAMGTETTQVFEHKKELNTSAMLLIILTCVIVLVIVIFILIARAKVPTR